MAPQGQHPPLGIGRIVREALSFTAGNLSLVSVLVFVPLLVLALVEFLLGIGNYAPSEAPAGLFENGTFVWRNIVAWAFTNTFGVTVYAFLVRYVYDYKTGNPASVTRSVVAAFAVFVPLAACDFLATLVAFLGLMAFILPGLYLFALWCVLVPSIVIENSRFQGFNRSAALTRDYRWPCVAAVALLLLTQFSLIWAFDTWFGPMLTAGDSWSVAGYIVANAALNSLVITIAAVMFTLIYLRLRDIKEGTAWLADVFD